MRDYFHCYSKRLACFIMAFGIRYEKKLINHKNGMPYYTFKKTERMDKIIDLYRKVIHTI